MSAAEAPDGEWLAFTEGLEPYERFRYIARYVLRAALDDATRYAADARIFEAVEDDEALLLHLSDLDRALKEDASLTTVERAFLCSAVAQALARERVDASCPWQAFRPLSLMLDARRARSSSH